MPPPVPAQADRPMVSVVIPSPDISGEIDSVLSRTIAACERIAPCEIIVVDDGSDSSAAERVRAWTSDTPVRLVIRDEAREHTGAVMRGVAAARGGIIAILDVELSDPSEYLPKLINPILDGSEDVVVGSRSAAAIEAVGAPLRRRIATRAAAWLATPFTDVHDPLSGCFAAKRSAFDTLPPDGAGGAILLELLAANADALRIRETPMTFRDRDRGASSPGVSGVAAHLRRLARMSGTQATGTSALRFAIVGAIGVGVDLSVFTMLSSLGVAIDGAHIGSFLTATVLNYILNELWSFRQPHGDRSRLALGRYLAFFAVCLASLFVRGGVVATSIDLGMQPLFAVLIGIVAAAGINFIGCALFVFARADAVAATIRWRLVALAVIFYSLLLRVVYMGAVDLLPEEAYYWNYAKHLDIGYLDHPPMIAWLIGLSTHLFGDTEFAVRIPALGCWIATMAFLCALSHRIVGRSAAFATCALIAFLPFYFGSGMLATPDAPLTACWAAALYFLHRVATDDRRTAWFGFGIAIGLGLLSKYTIALLGPVALCVLLIDRRARHWFVSPIPYIAALIALAIFSPVLIWNARNEWASFAFQSVRRLNQEPEFALHLLLGSILLLLSPVGLASAARALWTWRRGRGGVHRRDRRFLFIAVLVPLAVFIAFSVRHPPKLNWTGPLWLALLPLMCLDLVPVINRSARSRPAPSLPVAWRATIIGVFLLFGAGLHYLAIGVPGFGYPSKMPVPIAWYELGQAIERIEDEIELLHGGEEPIVIGMDHYFLASELAFYRTKAERLEGESDEGVSATSTRHMLGNSGLMYEQWFPREMFDGATCILVAYDSDDISHERLQPWFNELQPIKPLHITKNGRTVHTFYWRVGRSYRDRESLASGSSSPLR
jgi:dolichol-phosphate mannosyltransferase